jgi:hypothetical protein
VACHYNEGKAVKLRAPSAVIASATATVLTCESAIFSDVSDASFFAAGEAIEIWNRDGTKWASSGVRTIASVSGSVITLSVALPSVPSAGQVVRLASIPSYSEQRNTVRVTRSYAAFGKGDIIG